jgi:hypothetical protein
MWHIRNRTQVYGPSGHVADFGPRNPVNFPEHLMREAERNARLAVECVNQIRGLAGLAPGYTEKRYQINNGPVGVIVVKNPEGGELITLYDEPALVRYAHACSWADYYSKMDPTK